MLKQSLFRPPYTEYINSNPWTNHAKFDLPYWNQVTVDRPDKTKSMPSDLRTASKNRVTFDHHHAHKHQVNRSLHSKQVHFGPHTVNYPSHKKQFLFDPDTKTKSNSIPPTKIKLISTLLLQSSQFDPHSKIKSISVPSRKDQVNFDPHTKTKYF